MFGISKVSAFLGGLALATGAIGVNSAHAAPTIDGTMSAGEWGTPIKVYADNYVNGNDASGGTNQVSTYWSYDSNYVYGAIRLDSGQKAIEGANVYVYSSGLNKDAFGNAGVYGDGNDLILEGTNGWLLASPVPPYNLGGYHLYSPSTASYSYNGVDTVEFSIARSLLGNYDSFRYGGQLFAYEFHTGGDRVDGAIAAVPEPSSLALIGVGAAALLRRRRTANAEA